MKVLVACEYSGVVRDAFLKAGHDAMSCDLLETEKPGPHYQGSVFDVLDGDWDLLIAHPPCTYLTNSGALHLYEPLTAEERAAGLTKRHIPNEERWENMREGAKFFNALAGANIPKICVENPVMHRHGMEATGGRATQFIQPWQFGHAESKKTGFRLKGLAPLVETSNVYDHMMTLPKKVRNRVHYLSPGPERWKERSRTFTGVGAAMAEQWGAIQ